MQQHIKLVGILNIVYGSVVALAGLVILLVFGGLAGIAGFSHDADGAMGAGILGLIGVGITGLLFVIAAPSIVAGIGLLHYKGWARILTIVLSALHLPSFPLGTALGVYGLWTLLKPESEALFKARPMAVA